MLVKISRQPEIVVCATYMRDPCLYFESVADVIKVTVKGLLKQPLNMVATYFKYKTSFSTKTSFKLFVEPWTSL